MIVARPVVLAALLGMAAAACGSSSGAPDGGPAGDANDASGDGAASEANGDGATSDTAADGPRDAALDGRCPPGIVFGTPCEQAGAECVAEAPTAGRNMYYCVSCGSPLPMPDASPVPSSPRWQTILSCPP